MDDREWIADEALAVLAAVERRRRFLAGEDITSSDWQSVLDQAVESATGRPPLTPKARAIKAAVEATMGESGHGPCHDCAAITCYDCLEAHFVARAIRRAYLGTETVAVVARGGAILLSAMPSGDPTRVAKGDMGDCVNSDYPCPDCKEEE